MLFNPKNIGDPFSISEKEFNSISQLFTTIKKATKQTPSTSDQATGRIIRQTVADTESYRRLMEALVFKAGDFKLKKNDFRKGAVYLGMAYVAWKAGFQDEFNPIVLRNVSLCSGDEHDFFDVKNIGDPYHLVGSKFKKVSELNEKIKSVNKASQNADDTYILLDKDAQGHDILLRDSTNFKGKRLSFQIRLSHAEVDAMNASMFCIRARTLNLELDYITVFTENCFFVGAALISHLLRGGSFDNADIFCFDLDMNSFID